MTSRSSFATGPAHRRAGPGPGREDGAAPGAAPAGASGDDRTDVELIHAHAGGDPHAFTELVRRHRDRLWAVALRTLRDPDEAEDALQEALIATFRAAHTFRAQARVTTWLHRIVVNACLDRMRRRRARPTVPLPETGPGEPADDRDEMVERETSLEVAQALAGIPEDQRAAIVLVDVEGYSVAETAGLLGVAEGTVKSRCARGRLKLAKVLGHLRNPVASANVPGDVAGQQPSTRPDPPNRANRPDRPDGASRPSDGRDADGAPEGDQR